MLIPICLLALGLLMIYLEFFVPGGLVAIIGGLLVTAGVTVFSAMQYPLYAKVLFFGVAVGLVAGVCRLALWVIQHRKKDEFYLASDQEGYTAPAFEKELIGSKAIAATDLKPSGHILIAGKRFQAISESEYIRKGANIEILNGQSNYLIVREVSSE